MTKDNKKSLRTLKRFGSPPPTIDEASTNLEELEVPVIITQPTKQNARYPVDARTKKRTDRVMQFATRVTQEWNNKIREAACDDNKLLVEILEESLELYLQKRDKH